MRRSFKILSDESGHVIVLTAPYPSRSRTTSEQTSRAATLTGANSSPAAAQTIAQHCCFYCNSCGSPNLLPHSKIGLPFGEQSARRIDVRSVATVCGACKHVDCYSMFRGGRGYDTRHRFIQAPLVGNTICLAWLQCGIKGCPYPVPLFTTIDGDMSEEELKRLSATWVWDEVTCALNHRIQPAVLNFSGVALSAARQSPSQR